MIEKILEGRYDKIQLYHVRMAFSKEMNDIGKFQISKAFHLISVILQAIYYRFRYQITTLYFPPAGPTKIPFFRNAIILICIRPFFKNVCFHFHAAGISELYPTLGRFFRFLFRKAYYRADVGIRLSVNSTDDCSKLKVKKSHIIPYGIEDSYSKIKQPRQLNPVVSILFVGLLSESKGLMVLVNACHLLKNKGVDFSVRAMGKFESVEFEAEVQRKITEYGLEKNITFLGVLTGDKKFETYRNSDIFCFPTFFEAESFPVVLLEASCFSLPVISTKWRGVPSIVSEGENGYLVSIKDEIKVADKLQLLIENPELREQMGRRGRQLYLEKYTLKEFHTNIEHCLSSI